MANAEHLGVLAKGVAVWNQWRAGNPGPADLSGADLREAELSGADLSQVRLWGADLRGANLKGANVKGSSLSRANLKLATFSRANLSGAGLSGADLSGADLSGADLTESVFLETICSNVNLGSVHGLETVRHEGPSIIDFRTLAKSGPLPLVFLRGCGLPDQLIDYLPSLLNQAIQFYSCFISYSTKDQEFANRLYADLQNKGVRCWFAPHDIQSGKKIHEQIDEAIKIHEKLLLILSPASMESEWVKTEISKARKREVREKRRVLFPIRLVSFEILRDWECFDADTGKDSAREIREFFIPDFSDWKSHDDYQKAFERLTQDLKAENAASV
jgi:uncharacterized protein YjbI with pentapeptide repeats